LAAVWNPARIDRFAADPDLGKQRLVLVAARKKQR